MATATHAQGLAAPAGAPILANVVALSEADRPGAHLSQTGLLAEDSEDGHPGNPFKYSQYYR